MNNLYTRVSIRKYQNKPVEKKRTQPCSVLPSRCFDFEDKLHPYKNLSNRHIFVRHSYIRAFHPASGAFPARQRKGI